ncbi:transglycosylase domain-containing protein [Pandoraea bronchicola]|uniref:peptidoglycan glycosyltransferase n=1 Tax=Pandoraea bronchicola TaxID=2508287 RepID=A0A5E5BLG0_9BURK|nr:transglycosylase domain-containing protein [Pandoraea bronchicola]VVE87091.1 glycosyl transferase family 51 [Pandoraea bronchicola]
MDRRLTQVPLRVPATTSSVRWIKWLLLAGFLIVLAIAAQLLRVEIETSRLQARYLSELGRDIHFALADGPSDTTRFPVAGGPYDVRLGYASLPTFERRLADRGFSITAQARESPVMTSVADHGLFLPYEEKDQAGLQLFDSTGIPLYTARYPARIYSRFEAIPPLIVNALLFIEDRSLLDADQPSRNPAIDWGRFSRALYDQGVRIFIKSQPSPGGSTLATQIEKFRHSPGGRTATPPEKLRQIASASVRAYLGGPMTLPARRQIVVSYLNTVPLAAQPGIGEISGLGDGLAIWYGRDFDDVNRLLSAPPSAETLDAQAVAFKQALSLIIAQRAPSYFLRRNDAALEQLTNSYVRLLATNGIISAPLRDAALMVHLELKHASPIRPEASFVTRKAVTALRADLLNTLGVASFYDLDRLDLSVHATLDDPVQRAVSERLALATTPEGAKAAGLYGFEMLRPQDDPSRIAFSFTLFERSDGANLVRVQTDSVNQPFDVNQGARLNLGSTAKLRTLITYLQIVSELHARYAPMSMDDLRHVRPDRQDVLTRWALDYLLRTPDRSLRAMLNAAVERKYSASTGETFYTGGGAQTFTNFEATDNGSILTVHRAFQHSVNLVFVRLMRDIVRYEMIQTAGPSSHWLDDPVVREKYLMRFADQESRVYEHRFYAKYHGLTPDEALATLLHDVRKSPPKIATVLRSVAPDAPETWFDAQMRATLKGTPTALLTTEALAKLYAKYGIDRFNLNDRGYIASVHPLELWTVNYLRDHPDATEADVQTASREARVAAYSWLFKTRYHATQDRRIRHMVELRAYEEIGTSWRALGYPFAAITPSYAAAIGASGDRPAALAQLIGVVASDGMAVPARNLTALDFAQNTPYETHFAPAPSGGQTALLPEIVEVVHGLLRDVVLGGTAKRLADGMPVSNGRVLDVYGKTGTGDQRFNVFSRGRRLIESRKVNRTATFVFAIGNRFFGALTAYVHEPYAARYDFTSAMAVQLLKSLAPVLQPLLDADAAQVSNRSLDRSTGEGAAVVAGTRSARQ